MAIPRIIKTPAENIQNLCLLLSLQQKRSRMYDNAAGYIYNNSLRETFTFISLQSKQQAAELASQLSVLGEENKEYINILEQELGDIFENAGEEENMLDNCKNYEMALIDIYRVILAESHLSSNINKFISGHLENIICSFASLKLLNDLT
jgi:hypothetical protein